MRQHIAALVNDCVDIADNRKALYLVALHEVVDARILTVKDLNALRSLWANNSDSIYAFCELVKRIGSQGEDNVLLYRLARFAELKQLVAAQIHVLLQLHLLWLAAHPHVKSPMRSAMTLLNTDLIQFQTILGSVFDHEEDCLIKIELLVPFSAEKFHQQGVRVDENGTAFISQDSIQNLNNIIPPRRPNVSAKVVPLTPNNMDFNLICRYYNLSQLILGQLDLLQKSLDECIEAMRGAKALPNQFLNAPVLEIKKALLPVYYHAEFDREALAKRMEAEKYAAQMLLPIQVKPSELSQVVLLLLSRLNSPLLTPFIVHFAKVGFDFVRLNHFAQVLREKLNIDWLSQQGLDFLMQVSPDELTDHAIDFFGTTLKTDEKSTALALQARFQFVLWFGEASLEDNYRGLLSVVKRFSEKVTDPYLRPAMLKWIRDYGNIFSPPLTINLLVSVFSEIYPNHPGLLAVLRESADQIDLRLWEKIVRQPRSQEDRVAILSLCKTALSKNGRNQIRDWVFKLNAANERSFVNALIDQLFEHRLLTTKELSDLYFDTRFTNQFNCINNYFRSQKIAFLSTVNRVLLSEGVRQSVQENTAVDLQDSEARMKAQLQIKLDTYRNNNLISVEESGVKSYQPKGVLFGAALFTRESTRNAAGAFNQLSSKMQMDVAAIIQLIRDPEFKKQAGGFWETCCRDFSNAFSVYETQLRAFVQQPDRLVNYLFSSRRFNEYQFNYILQLCSPELKVIIEEFVVVVGCGHGLNVTVFDALLQRHSNPQYFKSEFPMSLPLLACYSKPANAQLPNINPIDQCKMTPEQLYQYEECEILSGELALRVEFQDRILNVPENVRRTTLDLSQPIFFHQIAPSDALGLRDPFFISRDDQWRFNVTQEKLRAALARYDVAVHQKPILFFGVINTGNHYVPYVVTKSKNGRVFVFTADPSAQSTLVGSVEYKIGQGVCPIGDKENLKRTMRRFFTHTFPGCVYEDIYATQMLRERDCGPISLFVLREILQKNLITVFDDKVLFDRNKITVQTAPCGYSSDLKYYYPSDFELTSRRARAYWHTVFTSDEPFNYKEALKSDCFEVDVQIPNENTYLDRAMNQFKNDQRQQHQSEFCLFLNHPTHAFDGLKQKLHEQGHLPSTNDIRVFIADLNNEINRSAPEDIKLNWTILYGLYFDNGDLSSNTLIEDVRNIVIYNLKEPIQEAIKENFKRSLSDYSHLLTHDNVACFIADFKQRESALFSCCDVEDVVNLERKLTRLARKKVIEKYMSRVVLAFDDRTIFNVLIAGRTDAIERVIRHYVEAEMVNNTSHTLHSLVVYLKQLSSMDMLFSLIQEKVEEALNRFVDVAYTAVKKRFSELLEEPMHHERLQTLPPMDLVHWLLPENTAGIIVGKDAQRTVLFNLVFSSLVEKTQKEFSSWLGELSEKRVAILFRSKKINTYFNTLELNQVAHYLTLDDSGQLSVTDAGLILNQIPDDAEMVAFKQFYASFVTVCEEYIKRALLDSLLVRCEQLFERMEKSIEAVIAGTRFYDVKNYKAADENSFLPLLSLLDKTVARHLFQNNRLTLMGRQLIDYLNKLPQFLSGLIDAVNSNQLIDRKLNTMESIFKAACELLRNGGYKGRRNQVLENLNVALGNVRDCRVVWQTLNYVSAQNNVAHVSVALKNLNTRLLENIRMVSSNLIASLRAENCDPASTTQVIRVVLCQLLNIDLSLQYPILIEVTAKQIDDAIVRKNAALSSTTLAQLVVAETRLIVVTPNQSHCLPTLSGCPNGLLELIARSIAWWRVHHHGISAVMHPTLFHQRVAAPGGLSAELLSLIEIINKQGDIHATLAEYILLNRLLISVENLTNTGKVIKNILDEFLMITQPFEINEVMSRRLLQIFSDRWKQLCADHPRARAESIPQNYLIESEQLSLFDQFCIHIATLSAKKLSFSNGHTFKMPSGFLMPGSAYDREIPIAYREFRICTTLQNLLGSETLNPVDDIPVNQLLFLDDLPVNVLWYISKTLAKRNESGELDFLHPQNEALVLTENQIKALRSYGNVGLSVFHMRYPTDPTDRSLRALANLIGAMVLDNHDGNLYFKHGGHDRLQVVAADFLKSLSVYPLEEQNALLRAAIPGVTGSATVGSVLNQTVMVTQSQGTCSYYTGKTLALVIHQYYGQLADALLPKDTKRASMKISHAAEFRYIDANLKKPFSSDGYAFLHNAAPALLM